MYNTFIIPKDIHCLKTMEYRNQKSATCCKYNKPHSYPAEDEGFKPPIPEKGYTGFRVQRIRSLCQSSFFVLQR